MHSVEGFEVILDKNDYLDPAVTEKLTEGS